VKRRAAARGLRPLRHPTPATSAHPQRSDLRRSGSYSVPFASAMSDLRKREIEGSRAESSGRRNTSSWRWVNGTTTGLGSGGDGEATDAIARPGRRSRGGSIDRRSGRRSLEARRARMPGSRPVCHRRSGRAGSVSRLRDTVATSSIGTMYAQHGGFRLRAEAGIHPREERELRPASGRRRGESGRVSTIPPWPLTQVGAAAGQGLWVNKPTRSCRGSRGPTPLASVHPHPLTRSCPNYHQHRTTAVRLS